MRFECEARELSAVTTKMARLAKNNKVFPLSGALRLEAAGNTLAVTWTDTNVVLTLELPVDVREEGKCLVPGRLLAEFMRELASDKKAQVTLEQTGKAALCISAGRQTINLNGYDWDDVPEIPEIEGDEGFTVPEDVFKDVLKVATAARSEEDAKSPALSGVLFDVKKSVSRIVATDGFRLALLECKEIDSDKRFELKIPATAIVAFGKLAKSDVRVTVEDLSAVTQAGGNSRSRVQLEASGVSMSVPVINGTFPDYKKLIPESFATTATIDRKALVQAVKAVTATQRSKAVYIALRLPEGDEKSGVLEMAGGDAFDKGREASTKGSVEAQVEGEGAKIGVNSAYLGLNTIGSDSVVVSVNGSGEPFQVTPKGKRGIKHLVMPVFHAGVKDL